MNRIASGLIIASCVFYSCTSRTGEISPVHEQQQTDSLSQDTIVQPEVKPVEKKLTAEQIQITKDLLYDQYTLEDTYPYKDTTRQFQWDKIKERLALLENIQLQPSTWAILQNYKNRNGEAPLVRSFKRNAYGRVADTLGIERYQSVPLYLLTDTLVPERYGQDGPQAAGHRKPVVRSCDMGCGVHCRDKDNVIAAQFKFGAARRLVVAGSAGLRERARRRFRGCF